MWSEVYETVGRPSIRPSVCPSHHSHAGFAAERRVGRRYRSTAAAGRQQMRVVSTFTADVGNEHRLVLYGTYEVS